MHKEPNDVLVMTTCKCRENTTNLVMTRTWFQEQLASKIAIGVEQEQKRIMAILEAWGVNPTILLDITDKEN